MSNKNLSLFIDASVNPQEKVGYGAYLLVDELTKAAPSNIKTKLFKNTSSTKLELETLLWAFENLSPKNTSYTVYTDCQNIIGLKSRRDSLEKKNYLNAKNEQIKNHLLYKEFYALIDSFNCDFTKVKGHKKTNEKDTIDIIFTLVDKASRSKLRNYI